MEKESKGFAILSSFWIKIIAIFTMTIDHVGSMLQTFIGSNYGPAIPFRYIGRIALPLFCFLTFEGITHSKKPSKYFLRLGIMATIISIALVVVEYAPAFDGFSLYNMGNIFIDLLLGALAVYLLRRKEWYFKLLSILPIGISITSFVVIGNEVSGNMLIHWFPFFLRPQYHFYSVGMIVLFYVGTLLSDLFLHIHSDRSGIPFESLKETRFERYSLNIISMGVVVFATLIFFLVSILIPDSWLYWHNDVQNIAIIAGAFVLLYSGKRGYNAKWFQYGSYLYYPLHILIIFGIGALL